MPPIGIILPTILSRNAFHAFKQFLVWTAERTGKLNMMGEALKLVSPSQFSNAKLPTHPELGGWKTGNPDFLSVAWLKWHKEVKQFPWWPRPWTQARSPTKHKTQENPKAPQKSLTTLAANPSYSFEQIIQIPSFNQNPLIKHLVLALTWLKKQNRESMTKKEEREKVLLHLVMNTPGNPN